MSPRDASTLGEYRRRRRFARTPEPDAGEKPAVAADRAPRFVVQRHSARRLHYDFRLERGDALASWAVPKGLPTVRGERRLAVHTEDHPLEYLTFAGEIPRGEYGAGVVDVYDSGTYEPAGEGADGHIKVRLRGARLDGVWSLVPAALDGDERNWLILRNDGSPEAPPLYEPMLATLTQRAPRGAGWLYEVELDGLRVLAHLRDGDPLLRTAAGDDTTARFSRLAGALGRGLRSFACVVDGVVCALGDDGVPSRRLLDQGKGILVLYAFDLVEADRVPLCDLPLAQRRTRLDGLVDERDGSVRLSHAFADGRALRQAARSAGLAGVVAKRAASPYRPGRSSDDWRILRG